MAERVRVGIVGTGFSAASHLDALRRIPGVEVVAITGRTPARSREAATQLGVPNACGSLRELLDQVDAVHNCTVNQAHAEVSAAVLEAGRHLLTEKPLATTSADSATLADLAARTPAVSGVCFNYRHFPMVRQAKALLDAGTYGRVHFVHGSYLQDWLLLESDWSWRLDPAVNGASRAVADIGSHWMDLVQYLTGDRIVEVFADLATLHPTRMRPAATRATFERAGTEAATTAVSVTSEDYGSVLLRFAGGGRGGYTLSQVNAGRKNYLTVELEGGSGALAWDQERPNQLWIGRRDAANQELLRDPGVLAPEAAALTRFPGGHQEGWPDGLRNLCEDFYGAVAAQRRGVPYRPSFATLDDGHRIVELVDAVLASHRAGRWVQPTQPQPAGR